jgi:hypothetical protein
VKLLLALLVGALASPVSVVDQDGNPRNVPSAKPTLLIYEDQDGGKQSQHCKDVVGKINTSVENQRKVDVFPVADLEKWNWWPAKKYALADIQKTAKEKRTTIYLDWTGAVRKAWGLAKKKNNLILVAPLSDGGKVLFASEGECTDAQLAELVAKLTSFGVKP